MVSIDRTTSTNPDFIKLNSQLDAELAIRDGKDHAFYAQFNTINDINNVIMAYENDIVVGCGAIKQHGPETMEIKRMFVPEQLRGHGIATKILAELEKWTADLGFQKCILETGYKQPEAIALYKRHGYQIIPNYGQYAGVENSVCFEKNIS